MTPSTAAGVLTAGISRAEALLRTIAAAPAADRTIGVLGPGGSGKSALLTAVRRTYEAAGIAVLDLHTATGTEPLPAGAIVIDDAHLLAAVDLERLNRLIDRPAGQLIVAFRPWPRPPELTTLVSRLRRQAPLTVLQPLGPAEVERRAVAILNEPVSTSLVTLLTEQTGGQPRLLDDVLAELQNSVLLHRPGQLWAADFALPDSVLERVGVLLDDLGGPARALLHAIAAGANVETGVLSALLGLPAGAVRDLVEQARGGGQLQADGRLIPLIRHALLQAESVERTRDIQLALLDIHADLGHDVVPVARALARSGIRNLRAAAVLIDAADGEQFDEPSLAGALYDDAVRAGYPADDLAVRRARTALRSGRLDDALRFADPVLARADRSEPGPDLADAIEVVATVMTHRGQLDRAAELYRWLGQDRIGGLRSAAALAFLASGEPQEAAAVMELASGPNPPTMVAGAIKLMFDGITLSVSDSYCAALSALNRATSLIESVGAPAPLPDSPSALAALVAIGVGEFDLAESVLERAIDQRLGGQLFDTRHRLLLGWVAMLRGHRMRAEELLADAQPVIGAFEPRDQIFATALAVGLARRSGDPTRLSATWAAARQVIVGQPIDLFMLLPLGEFAIAAALLDESQLLNTHLNRAWRLLGRLGRPTVWAGQLQWACVQAALVGRSRLEIEPLALALDQAKPATAYTRALAAATHAWLGLLAGNSRPSGGIEIDGAAAGLRAVGLSFEADQLLDQIPGDPSPVESIDPAPQAPICEPAPTAGSILSNRELEVAELLLLNQTYREIGQHLFISSKTVEHHVARMKQRIGATHRSELFAELRQLTENRINERGARNVERVHAGRR